MPTNDHTASTPAINPQNPATWLKPDQPLVGADGRDWSWCYVWFKGVDGFPGYKVGTNGSVWSCFRNVKQPGKRGGFKWVQSSRWTRMATAPRRRGYRSIGLRRHGQGKTRFRLHTLVLESFWGPAPPGMICRHLDGNTANNDLRNLAWGTPSDNNQDQIRHGTIANGSRNGNSRLADPDIPVIRRLRREGMSAASIGRRYGVSDVSICNICLGKTWAHVPG